MFRKQFAAGVPTRAAQVMATGQRPITLAALQEPVILPLSPFGSRPVTVSAEGGAGARQLLA
ncbi:hypothetical protein [Streptomyces sp. NPDC003006]